LFFIGRLLNVFHYGFDPKHVANPLDWFHDSERKHSVLVLLDQKLFQTTYQDIATSFLSEIPLQRDTTIHPEIV